MLKSTTELINHLSQKSTSYSIIDSHVHCIRKLGSKADADILLDYYLSHPFNYRSSDLLPLFKKFGDNEYAERLFKLAIDHSKWVEDAGTEILTLLGHLKYEPAKDLLKKYAFGKTGDYYSNRGAVLGLLNFDCAEFEGLIETEIAKCYNKSLFPEYIPALVCKIGNREKYLKELFILGNEYASVDCNAGIVLGFSLCGDLGRDYFMNALKNPHWEVYSGSTGTVWATYEGLKNLGISFKELYWDIKNEDDQDSLQHLLWVLLGVLERRLRDYDDDALESFADIYELLYAWEDKNTSNNLVDLADKVDEREEAYKLERILELKVTEELILRNVENSSHVGRD